MSSWTNWNEFNNWASHAVLNEDRLGELLDGLGLPLRYGSGRLTYRTSCPMHGGDGKALGIRLEGGTLPILWTCFSAHCERKYKPTLLGLVRGLLSAQEGKDVSTVVAVDYLKDFLGNAPLMTPFPARKPVEIKTKVLNLSREQVRSRLTIPSPSFLTRGFSAAVLDAYDVGHSPWKKKTIVPIYDDSGQVCVGHLERAEKPVCPDCKRCHFPADGCRYGHPKWRVLEGFPKSDYLYGYHQAARSGHSIVLLVEGPGDVLKAAEAGYPAVACLGTDLSEAQAEKLARLNREVVIAFDNDAPGRENAKKVSSRLCQRKVSAGVWGPPDRFKDVGEMAAGDIVEWMRKRDEHFAELDEVLGLGPPVVAG